MIHCPVEHSNMYENHFYQMFFAYLLAYSQSKVAKIINYNCTIGGLNVSNLMGIKRRMIDNDKKITFYFLQNV
jgi:hypothetical protein